MPYRDLEKARIQSRAWYAANLERAKARRAAYYVANKEETIARQKERNSTKEGKAARAAQARKRRAKDPEKARKANNEWKARNGYSSWLVYSHRMEAIAGNKRPDTCEACGRGGKIVFDHCHSGDSRYRDRSSKALRYFRGWLCERCNVALGMVDNRPEILRQLIDYLMRSQNRLPSA